MIVVMRLIALTGDLTGGVGDARLGQYLMTYNPEAFFGRGDISTTDDVQKARTWPNARLAMEEYRVIPQSRRFRSDGKPNRPLTAFTVEIFPKEEA